MVGTTRDQVQASTINSELSVLRNFYRWCFHCGHTPNNLSNEVPEGRRTSPRLPRYLTEYEIGQLLAAPDISTFCGFRDMVMMTLAYDTGVRASELIAVETTSLMSDRHLFVPRRKGHIDRYVPYSEATQQVLNSYIENIRPTVKPGKSRRLFLTNKGHAFSSGRSFWEIVDKYSHHALGCGRGYERITRRARRKACCGHSRFDPCASFATHLMMNECELVAIQKFLGHANLATTAKYFAVDVNFLIEQHKKYFPSRLCL